VVHFRDARDKVGIHTTPLAPLPDIITAYGLRLSRLSAARYERGRHDYGKNQSI
jgi:hypothetical protein